MPTLADTPLLSQLVSRKKACLSGLAQLGELQSRLIASEALPDLMRVLAAKHRLLTDLQDLESQLEPFRDQSPEDRLWASPAERAACAADAAECERLRQALLEQEKAAEHVLRGQRDAVSAELLNFSATSAAHAAYVGADAWPQAGFDISTEA